ncbi:ABC transporter permease [Allorhizocola rhizosphaerae]|uniref:branched-chain amino acid ABC transporter permease n=1 Tax=Allorhizocola rhizosphaerae TaxID=1872709 RepID=UPI001FED01CB|nr:ABC transporter permease [Allorhizocola rhizosphaerae]
MGGFLALTILGLVTGAGYAVAAGGLVLTYSTSRVFNVAHGAIGMVMAFLYWELSVNQGLPVWLTLLLVVGVVAPVLGAVVERIMMRQLADAPVGATLVVTVGLLVMLIGVAQAIWPSTARTVPPFFAGSDLKLGGAVVSVHDLITIAAAIVAAAALYGLLTFTRVGIAMRAAVDNRGLLALYGARTSMLSAMSWGIGAALAALAGILLTPVVGLSYHDLTLLVMSAYAAAVAGRLLSLPWTFVGALLLGLSQSYAVGYLPTTGALSGLRAAIPALFLFAALLLAPQAQLRVGQIRGIRGVPVPGLLRALGFGALAIGAAAVAAYALPGTTSDRLSLGFIYGIVMLSLVPLTGYGGYVSLAQLTFVGVGAITVARLGTASPLALLAAAGAAALVGALVALPALRLQGLYLALSTLAFGLLMDKLVFQASFAFGFNGSLAVPRILGLDAQSHYLILTAVAFVGVGLGVLALRRSRYGRYLIAMRDSPAGCATLGLNLRWTRVRIFALSAGIAGFAGGLFGGLRQTVAATDFQLFNSLPLLLLAVVAGVTSVTGSLLGGMLLMLLPVLASEVPAVGGLAFLVIGVASVGLGRDPNGLASRLFALGRWRPPSSFPSVRLGRASRGEAAS